MESEITPAAPRPRGRPARPEHEANDAALAAATWLLLNEGYAATTMEAVAKRAGLAKKTLYRFAANREDLVALVVRSWTDGFRPALSADAQSASEVAPALAEILRVTLSAPRRRSAPRMCATGCTRWRIGLPP